MLKGGLGGWGETKCVWLFMKPKGDEDGGKLFGKFSLVSGI